MTEVVRKGIQEAQLQLQKANEERLLEKVRLLSYETACCDMVTLLTNQCLIADFAGTATTNTCSRFCAELVFSIPSLTKRKNV